MNLLRARRAQHLPVTTARRPAPTTERGADKREAILQAALELFVERGFHGTAVPEVADRAGVGAGTIYRYFVSKEALVNELYQRHKQAISTRVLRDFPLAASAREQYGALWRRMVKYAKDEPLGFAFLELHNHGSYLDAESKAIEERITNFGMEFIRQAQRRGDLRLARIDGDWNLAAPPYRFDHRNDAIHLHARADGLSAGTR